MMKITLGRNRINMSLNINVSKTLSELSEKAEFLKCELIALGENPNLRRRLARELNSVNSDICYINQSVAHQTQTI
jgi:hypothetical protein